MSVKIDVCRDIEEFQESVIAGMNAGQTLFCLAGIACGAFAGIVAYNLLHLPLIICGYASSAAAAPAIITGFSVKDGMNFFQRRKAAAKIIKQGTLYPVSTESPEYIEKLINNREESEKKQKTGGIDFEFLWKK